MEWVDCPVVAADRDLFPACRVERAPVRLVLRIQAGYPRRDFRLPPAVFGLSYLDEKGKGAYADVYAPGAELLARPHPELRSVMLGHLMAHELGHLLLASPAHAGTGIMQSPWKGHTVQLARQGGLTFIDVQADRIAANLRRRRESLPAPGLAGGGSN
jgi:hypothetical protein